MIIYNLFDIIINMYTYCLNIKKLKSNRGKLNLLKVVSTFVLKNIDITGSNIIKILACYNIIIII